MIDTYIIVSCCELYVVFFAVTPFQCRLRDCTYSAPLFVNIKYTRQRQIVIKNGVNALDYVVI